MQGYNILLERANTDHEATAQLLNKVDHDLDEAASKAEEQHLLIQQTAEQTAQLLNASSV